MIHAGKAAVPEIGEEGTVMRIVFTQNRVDSFRYPCLKIHSGIQKLTKPAQNSNQPSIRKRITKT